MGLSIKRSATQDSDNVVRFISRALAGEWPYDPIQVEYRRHPSLAARLSVVSRFFVMPDSSERSIQIAVEVARRSARLLLKNLEVRHFEVIPMTLDDHVAVTHIECDGEGCEQCNDLGVLFQGAPGHTVSLMGWLAVTYVG